MWGGQLGAEAAAAFKFPEWTLETNKTERNKSRQSGYSVLSAKLSLHGVAGVLMAIQSHFSKTNETKIHELT